MDVGWVGFNAIRIVLIQNLRCRMTKRWRSEERMKTFSLEFGTIKEEAALSL